VFVSDGYGNSRVAVFTYEGEFTREWGSFGSGPSQFSIPHNIEIDSYNRVYVADRENGRTQIFHKNGTFIDQWNGDFEKFEGKAPYYARHLSALSYSSSLELMFLIEGTNIVVRDIAFGRNGEKVLKWHSNSRSWPHDIAIARDTNNNLNVYIAELDGKTISRYVIE